PASSLRVRPRGGGDRGVQIPNFRFERGQLYRCSNPAFSRTVLHFLYSSIMYCRHACGVEPFTSTPALTSRSRIGCSSSISLSALLSLTIAGCGMPFGPNRPYHVVTS